MKYVVYCTGSKCKVYNNNIEYVLNMAEPEVSDSCPVSTGGQIILPGGDILNINEQYGPFYP